MFNKFLYKKSNNTQHDWLPVVVHSLVELDEIEEIYPTDIIGYVQNKEDAARLLDEYYSSHNYAHGKPVAAIRAVTPLWMYTFNEHYEPNASVFYQYVEQLSNEFMLDEDLIDIEDITKWQNKSHTKISYPAYTPIF